MRLMSFAWTTDALLEGRKTVTRRLGWLFLKEGDRLVAVRKGQGIPKGGKVERLAVIEVLSVRREPLNAIDALDVAREGGLWRDPEEFVASFRKGGRCAPTDDVTRIEFRLVRLLP